MIPARRAEQPHGALTKMTKVDAARGRPGRRSGSPDQIGNHRRPATLTDFSHLVIWSVRGYGEA